MSVEKKPNVGKAVFNRFMAWITPLLTSGLTGFTGFAARLAIKYGGRYIYDFLVLAYQKIETAADDKKDLKEYEKEVTKPDTTVDDRGKAYEDLING